MHYVSLNHFLKIKQFQYEKCYLFEKFETFVSNSFVNTQNFIIEMTSLGDPAFFSSRLFLRLCCGFTKYNNTSLDIADLTLEYYDVITMTKSSR